MVQPFRAPDGGAIDRSRVWSFTFDGTRYEGHPGDTLASALMANGVRVVGRSFKYHRPRGIVSAGVEEPNALVQLDVGAKTEPNTRATLLPLTDGLVASSQNRFPSLGFDLGAVAGLTSRIAWLAVSRVTRSHCRQPAAWYHSSACGPLGLSRR